MKPGDIYFIQFDPSVGSEIQKSRPGLIVQKSPSRNTIIVLPISSKKIAYSTFEIVLPKDTRNKLYTDSVVILDRIKSFDKRRFIGKIGTIQPSQLAEITTRLKSIF